MHKISLFLILFFSVHGWAQGTSQTDLSRNGEPSKLRLGVSFQVPTQNFDLTPKTDAAKSTEFEPNESVSWGLEGSYDGYRFGVHFPMPESDDSIEKKGHTRHLDIMLGHYLDAWGGDLYYQRYRGFYFGSEDDGDDLEKVFPQRPDLETNLIGANIYHSFFPQNFSMRAFSNPKMDQETQGGSIIGLLSLSQFRFHGDRPLIANDTLIGSTMETAILGGGYAYHYVHNHHALAGHVLMGVGPQWQRDQELNGTHNRTAFAYQVAANGNYTYEFQGWQMGLEFKINNFTSQVTDDYEFTLTSLDAKVFCLRDF